MNPIEKLSKIFGNFPGIGPRQARRFVYFLLNDRRGVAEELRESLAQLKEKVDRCKFCGRFFATEQKKKICAICADPARDESTLLVVARDFDLEAIEKSGTYRGRYFVIGGSIPLLSETPTKFIRSRELLAEVERLLKKGLKEVILAMNASPEGENTAAYLEKILKKLLSHDLKITTLGRGLSSGMELEYADPLTIRAAIAGRQSQI
jgi:recombination protein RecR